MVFLFIMGVEIIKVFMLYTMKIRIKSNMLVEQMIWKKRKAQHKASNSSRKNLKMVPIAEDIHMMQRGVWSNLE